MQIRQHQISAENKQQQQQKQEARVQVRVVTSIMSILRHCFLLLLLGAAIISQGSAQPQCERLKNTLTYTQKDAPRDLSKVVSTTLCKEV